MPALYFRGIKKLKLILNQRINIYKNTTTKQNTLHIVCGANFEFAPHRDLSRK